MIILNNCTVTDPNSQVLTYDTCSENRIQITSCAINKINYYNPMTSCLILFHDPLVTTIGYLNIDDVSTTNHSLTVYNPPANIIYGPYILSLRVSDETIYHFDDDAFHEELNYY